MTLSTSGREYRQQSLMASANSEETYWTCLDCGALVGPMRKHREKHDEWHDRIERAVKWNQRPM